MNYSYEQLQELLSEKLCPLVFCDLDTFDKNLDLIGKELEKSKKVVRLGTKSIRVPQLIDRALKREFVNGVLIFHPNEIKYLQENFQVKDFLLAYPIFTKNEADLLSEAVLRDPESTITAMVDSIKHLDILENSAREKGVILHMCIDCDMGIHFLGIYAGTYRSSLVEPREIVKLAEEIKKRPHLKYRGIMGYEAQNASLGDTSLLYRKMKAKSRTIVNERRLKIVEALKKAGFSPDLVNGGGSGCFGETAAETSVSEIGLGSALYKPHIFDSIKSMEIFKPSLFMVLRIVREPRSNISTAFSGGYVCSGSNNLPPIVVMPESLETIGNEGFGEVQTPFKFNTKKVNLGSGDLVICRLAKAGEPLERFNEVIILSKGKIYDYYPTYRGTGLWLG
ncbi:MAG: alanine racemase [Candidatus Hodarchaeota archaeon]